MGAGEVLGAEAARLEQRDGQRVAHGERRGRAGGRRETEGAGLLLHAHVDIHVGDLRHAGLLVAGQRDEGHTEALDERQDRDDLAGAAGVRDREHHILRGDHAEIPVARLAGVHEECRRAGARERRRDLAADVAGLAHAGDHDAATACEHEPAGLREAAADPPGQGGQRIGLGLDDRYGRRAEARVRHVGGGWTAVAGGLGPVSLTYLFERHG